MRATLWRWSAVVPWPLVLLVAMTLGVGACPSATVPPRPVDSWRGGVHVAQLRSRQMPRGPRVQGRAGDWMLETRQLRLVVGEANGSISRELVHGSLLDATATRWVDDALSELAPVLEVAGKQRALSAVRVEPVLGDDIASLRVTHRDARGELRVVTDIELSPKQHHVLLSSRVTNVGRRSLAAVRIGDRARWFGQPPFAPGLGSVTRETTAKLSWFALPSSRQTYAVVFPDGPVEVRFAGALRETADQLMLAAAVDLAPGGAATYHRALVVTPGKIAVAAEVAWRLLGQSVERVRGKLVPAPEWAEVSALDPAGHPMMQVAVAADGRFSLPLPEGRYRLVLTAPGGHDVQEVLVEKGRPAPLARFIVPVASQLVYRVTVAGALVPARLIVRGVSPTRDPQLGPAHEATGAGISSYTATGEGSLSLPPGRYRITATHGPLYDLGNVEVTLAEGAGATARFALDHVVKLPGWVGCDFHLHAAPSGDSLVSLPDRVTALLAEGVELAVATDHNHVTDYAPAVAELGASGRIATARGVEITTQRWGHFNAFPLEGDRPPPYSGVTPAEIFDAVRSMAPGAVLQVNHPRMEPELGYFDLGGLRPDTASATQDGFSFDFDVIEVFNGFARGSLGHVEKVLADWYALLDNGRLYTAVGNSDSHNLGTQWAGYPRTYVQLGEGRAPQPDAVAEALKAGRAMVTTGPIVELFVGGELPGSVVAADDGGVEVRVRVQAAPWVDVDRVQLISNGKEVTRLAPQSMDAPLRLDWSGRIEVTRDAWVLAVVRGNQPLAVLPGAGAMPFAFTNPVFIDADADGAFRGAKQPPLVAADAGAVQLDAAGDTDAESVDAIDRDAAAQVAP